MLDYFANLLEYVKTKYEIKKHNMILHENQVVDILGFQVRKDIKYIYEHYNEFVLSWSQKDGKYIGGVRFVPYNKLVSEHNEIQEMAKICYDMDSDEFEIANDILHWYPLFFFPNGDAFCLDDRDGKVVFYEHEVYDNGKNLHGLVISMSIDDLYEKWNTIHFADVYYWDEICTEEGIDVDCEFARKFYE